MKMNKITKYISFNKLFDLLHIVTILTLLISADPSNASSNNNNDGGTRQVQPPATSSITDRLHTIFRTSDATPTVDPHICHNETFPNVTSTDDDAFSHSALFEELIGNSPLLEELASNPLAYCQACNPHDDLIEANLKLIQKLVLQRLGFNAPPNMTRNKLPHVNRQIIEKFEKEHHIKRSRVNTARLGVQANRDSISASDSDDDSSSLGEMQADAPSSFGNEDDYEYFQKEVYEEEEDDYFPITERVYVFPKSSKYVRHRHNKIDVLQFHFDNVQNSIINEAFLHIFVHSARWLKRHEPNFTVTDTVNLTVHRVKRKEKSYHQFESQITTKLPLTKGHYLKVNITKMVNDWYNAPQTNYGLVIKLNGDSRHQVAVTDNEDKLHAPYIEMTLKDSRKKRTKRSLTLNCKKDDNEKRCCKYPLLADFEDFGWDWIIAPKSYMANYCAGECKLSFLPKYIHTHVWQLTTTTSATPCCSPTRMSPLVLLYFDNNLNIVQSTIPSMSVERCSCS